VNYYILFCDNVLVCLIQMLITCLSAVAQWINVINHSFSWTTTHLDIQQQKNQKNIKRKDISKIIHIDLEKRKKRKKEKKKKKKKRNKKKKKL
jgi:hypothetical protein